MKHAVLALGFGILLVSATAADARQVQVQQLPNAAILTRESAGHPLHIVSPEGVVPRSFGGETNIALLSDVVQLRRIYAGEQASDSVRALTAALDYMKRALPVGEVAIVAREQFAAIADSTGVRIGAERIASPGM